MKPTKLEKSYIDVERKYDELRDEAERYMREKYGKDLDKLTKKKAALKEKLVETGDCNHTRYTKFTWEWDNGYGRQAWLPGLRCSLCKEEDRWPNMGGVSGREPHLWSLPSRDTSDY